MTNIQMLIQNVIDFWGLPFCSSHGGGGRSCFAGIEKKRVEYPSPASRIISHSRAQNFDDLYSVLIDLLF